MTVNRRVYAFLNVPTPPRFGRAELPCLTTILLAGLAGFGWLSAAMLAGRALRELFPYCC
jgi:hypothetical protein